METSDARKARMERETCTCTLSVEDDCPTHGVTEASDVEALLRWLSNEGDGGIWEELTSTTARPLAEALVRSSWLAARLAEAERVGAQKALRDAADEWAAEPDSWGDSTADYRNELRDRADRMEPTDD